MSNGFEIALNRLKEVLNQLEAEGIPRETANDAALMASFGSMPVVCVVSSLRGILQFVETLGKDEPGVDERKFALQEVIRAFGKLLIEITHSPSEGSSKR